MRALPIVGAPVGERETAVGAPRRAEPEVRGERVLSALDRVITLLDRASSRLLPERFDPMAQTGAIANTSFLVAVVTGVVVLVWYRPSVHLAYDSVRAMDAARFGAGLVRSLHRYSSDACMAFVLLHATKLFLARRFTGARWVAWVTGLALVGMLWLVGWLGYWLVWDARAQKVAIGTARMLDGMPIFADPLSRSFLADETVNSLTFFVVFFMHMLLPLAMGIALWLHITRLSRPHFLTRRTMTLWVVGALVALSLLFPADTAAPAKMTVAPGAMRIDALFLLPLALTDRLRSAALLALAFGGGALALSIPWLLRRKRAEPVRVELSRCNGCRLCYEDCPYDAIRMVPRTDGRAFDVEAQIDPDVCVGCGVCVGSCDGAALELPWMPTLSERRKLDAWVDSLAGAGSPPLVAFVCAESAATSLRVDAATGTSPDLPGYRVFGVPCSGWVEPRIVERVFRHGGRGVLVVACGPGGGSYREGGTWTKLRLAGERRPSLRSEAVPADRVRVVELFRGEKAALVEEARRFRESLEPRTLRGAHRWAWASGIAVAALASLATARASSMPYAPAGGEAPMLVVSFKHPGQVADRCRELSEAEKAKLPIHMRTDKVCERRRVPVRLQVLVDGEVALDREYPPKGLWGDGNSIAIERLETTPGKHDVRVRIGDRGDRDEMPYESERTIDAAPRRSQVVVFDRVEGFRWM